MKNNPFFELRVEMDLFIQAVADMARVDESKCADLAAVMMSLREDIICAKSPIAESLAVFEYSGESDSESDEDRSGRYAAYLSKLFVKTK
jgi:hypothetical protein